MEKMPTLFGLTTTNMTKDQLIASLTIILGLSGAMTYSDALWADTAFCTVTDPKTGYTCEEMRENPELDVYYVVDAVYFNDATLWETSHQNPETVRWNTSQTQFILKYDGLEVPRGEVGANLGLHNPKNHQQILELMNSATWKIEDPADPTVKKQDPRSFAEDDIFSPE